MSDTAHDVESVAFAGGRHRLGPDGAFEVEVAPFRLATSLVTNDEAVAVLNGLGAHNRADTAYEWVNTVNVNYPVREVEPGRWAVDPHAGSLPLIGVTWRGASVIARELGGRLPTEAEWEVADRAAGSEDVATSPWRDDQPERAHEAHLDAAGLRGMRTNVRQWCEDWFVPGAPYPLARGIDVPPAAQVMKVVRGGSWNKHRELVDPAKRHGKWWRHGGDGTGVRVCFAEEGAG